VSPWVSPVLSSWGPESSGQVGYALPAISPWWAYLSLVSSALSAFHGYRRNLSVGWAVGWGLAGALFPVITPAIAVAQGFGKRA